jgi:hypothetical protein
MPKQHLWLCRRISDKTGAIGDRMAVFWQAFMAKNGDTLYGKTLRES